MASPPGGAAGKLSFAKIAAMAPPPKPAPQENTESGSNEASQNPAIIFSASKAGVSKSSSPGTKEKPSVSTKKEAEAVNEATHGLQNLEVTDQTETHVHAKASEHFSTSHSHGGDEASSHLSDSSHKPNGSDTKSLVSDNTFAMEEKGSLRPDDSASVQAADDEEPFFIPPMLIRPEAQQTLENGEETLQSSANDRELTKHAAMGYPAPALGCPPRFGDMIPSSSPVYPPLMTDPDSFARDPPGVANASANSGSISPPDSKLLEAMGTPKDRFFVLQQEEKLIEFLQESKSENLDLALQSSYERLLMHRLADYYGLPRIGGPDGIAIRLVKPVSFNMPMSLLQVLQVMTGKDANSAAPVAMKIMRRNAAPGTKMSHDSSTAASSSVPSKSTSETGAETTSDEGVSSPMEAAPPNDKAKKSREEREVEYMAARERIFKGFQEGSNAKNSGAELSVNVSRSSSSSGRKKGHRQKTPKDDSFEARSSFVVGFPGMPMHIPPQPQWSNFNPINSYQPPYGMAANNSGMAQITPPNSTPYNQHDSAAHYQGMAFSNNYPNQFPPQDAWSGSQSPPIGPHYGQTQQYGLGYGAYNNGTQTSQYAAASPPFIPSNQPWPQQHFQQPYQGMQGQLPQNGTPWANYQSPPNYAGPGQGYPNGQTPTQQYQAAPVSSGQSRSSGSYNRPTFNPQTQSFVPNGPTRQNMHMHNRPSHSTSTTLNMNINMNFVQPPQERSESDLQVPTTPSRRSRENESLQKKWGTPSHLPKKPPTPEMPFAFNIENTPVARPQMISSISSSNIPKPNAS